MDVESRFVWTPVRMVLMLRRCAITSRWGHGPQALRALRASPRGVWGHMSAPKGRE